MTTAFEMYKGVLLELVKHQSPDFDVEDFNYFMPKAVESFYKDHLDEFETTQKVSDKISCMIKSSSPIVYNANNLTSDKVKDVPEDYRHLVNCLVSLRYKTATAAYALNVIRKSYTKRYTGDGQAYIMDNYYLRPLVSDADVRLYHRVIGDKLSILTESESEPNTTVVIASAVIEYFAIVPNIALDEDYTILQDTLFPEHANREIVTRCAQLFLENESNPRLQTISAVNQ